MALTVFGLLIAASMGTGGYVVKTLLYMYGDTDGRSIDELDVLDNDFWEYNALYSLYFTLAWAGPLVLSILCVFMFCQTLGIAGRICIYTMCGGADGCCGDGRGGKGDSHIEHHYYGGPDTAAAVHSAQYAARMPEEMRMMPVMYRGANGQLTTADGAALVGLPPENMLSSDIVDIV